MSEAERRAEYENRWASGGLSPYYAFTDSLLDMESNRTLADFAREKIRERIHDPVIAEKMCPDYPILTRRLSPETDYLEAFNQPNVELVDLNERPISRFTSTGIVVGETEIELDAVILVEDSPDLSGSTLDIITGDASMLVAAVTTYNVSGHWVPAYRLEIDASGQGNGRFPEPNTGIFASGELIVTYHETRWVRASDLAIIHRAQSIDLDFDARPPHGVTDECH